MRNRVHPFMIGAFVFPMLPVANAAAPKDRAAGIGRASDIVKNVIASMPNKTDSISMMAGNIP